MVDEAQRGPPSPGARSTVEVTYRDRYGQERALLDNDGRRLGITLRGLRFEGQSLDDFRPVEAPRETQRFSLDAHGVLCGYVLVFALPMTLIDVNDQPHTCTLGVHLDVGEPRPTSVPSHEWVTTSLTWEGLEYESGPRDTFEDALVDLHAELPAGALVKSCFTCDFSDYSPYGNGLFGDLACFRDTKASYRRVDGKVALFALWDECAGPVQETWSCGEWEPRHPGRGYRG